MIHNSELNGMPNLQGIKPILKDREVNINLETKIPWDVFQYARMLRGVSSKLVLAQHMLGLPAQKITSNTAIKKHFKTIWYFDKNSKNMVTLYDAVKNS